MPLREPGVQHVPPGIHENYNSFSSGNSITEKAKEIITEGPGGGKGYKDRFAVFNLAARSAAEGTGGSPYLKCETCYD
jgi:hypothetical protein